MNDWQIVYNKNTENTYLKLYYITLNYITKQESPTEWKKIFRKKTRTKKIKNSPLSHKNKKTISNFTQKLIFLNKSYTKRDI